jgi:hypothetical protein
VPHPKLVNPTGIVMTNINLESILILSLFQLLGIKDNVQSSMQELYKQGTIILCALYLGEIKSESISVI